MRLTGVAGRERPVLVLLHADRVEQLIEQRSMDDEITFDNS